MPNKSVSLNRNFKYIFVNIIFTILCKTKIFFRSHTIKSSHLLQSFRARILLMVKAGVNGKTWVDYNGREQEKLRGRGTDGRCLFWLNICLCSYLRNPINMAFLIWAGYILEAKYLRKLVTIYFFIWREILINCCIFW